MEPDSKNFETPDVIVIDCDDDLTIADTNSSSKSHKKKREVTLCKVDNLERLYIKQNVRVKKQKIKCVINLNTNVCDSKRKLEQNYRYKSHRNKERLERIVPKCSRPICQSAISDILRNKKKCCKNNPPSIKKHKSQNKSYKPKKHSSGSKSSRRKHSQESKKEKSKKVKKHISLSVSPLLQSPLLSDITYEDISLDSFKRCSDTDLDKLIRRTKERERRMCVTPELCLETPLFASTPRNVIELSSDEEIISINESIHSIETFVLEPQLDCMAYSPIASSDNISLECIEEKEEVNKSLLPKIELKDTKFDTMPCYTKEHIKCFDNNNIESKTNIVNFMNKHMVQDSKQNMVSQENCEKNELKSEFLKILPLYEASECKPTFTQLDMPCTMYFPQNNSIKIEK